MDEEGNGDDRHTGMKTHEIYRLVALTTMAVLLAMLTGCRTKYVPVETVRTEYVAKTDTVVRQDSVIMHDSVAVYVKGDTVYLTRQTYKDRLRYIYKAKTDTIHKTDTISKVVTVEAKKKPSLMEQAKEAAGEVALVIMFIGILAVVWKIVKKN